MLEKSYESARFLQYIPFMRLRRLPSLDPSRHPVLDGWMPRISELSAGESERSQKRYVWRKL